MSEITHELLQAVSEKTGVPVQFLRGSTIPEVWESAQRAVDWKYATAPQSAMSAVSPLMSSERITSQQIVNGSGDYLGAWRSGRLAPAGIPQPPPRRTGEHGRNARP